MDLPKYPTDKYHPGDIEHFDEYRESYKQFASGIKDIRNRYPEEIIYRCQYPSKYKQYNEFYCLYDYVLCVYVPPQTEWISVVFRDTEVVYHLQPESSLEQILEQARTLPKDRSETHNFTKVKVMSPIMCPRTFNIRTPTNVNYIITKYMSSEENEYDEEYATDDNGEYLGTNYILRKHYPHVTEIKKLVERDTYYFLDQSTNFAGFWYTRKDRIAKLHQIYHPDNIIRKLDRELKLKMN